MNPGDKETLRLGMMTSLKDGDMSKCNEQKEVGSEISMLISFYHVFLFVVLVPSTMALAFKGLRLRVRLMLNVHTSRSCRKCIFVATSGGLWIAPVCMARRDLKVSLF